MITSKTKIVATIGPVSEKEDVLEKLIIAGIDVARLNFSHGSHEEQGNRIKLIRKISKKINRHIAIIADIQGPKIRIGSLPDTGIELKNGQEITIDASTKEFKDNNIPLPSSLFKEGTKPGHVVFLDDGTLQIKVTAVNGSVFTATVLKGGILFPKKGVNVPSLEITSSILNEKDKQDMQFAVKAGADFIALSFLRNANDIKEARKFLGKAKIKVIAKIERPEALKNIEEIIDEADAIMVARGDLGIETPLWELPVRQKEIIELVRSKMKPVIVATQMLDSMIRNPIPIRAEVSDVANAVFDATDCVMLSGESANGKYPVEAVEMMRKILISADKHQDPLHEEFQDTSVLQLTAAARSAVNIAENSNAKAIITEVTNGIFTKAISHFRPLSPIIAVAKNEESARTIALLRGVIPFVSKKRSFVEDAKKFLLKNSLVERGDKVVCTQKSKDKNQITIETI